MGLGTRRGRGGKSNGEQASGDEGIIQQMNQIARKYSPTGEKEDAVLQDFNSFRQALHVASAEVRIASRLDSSAGV